MITNNDILEFASNRGIFTAKNTYAQVDNILKKYRESDETLDMLIKTVDMQHANAATAFKTALPELFDTYGHIFMLIALGLDPDTIAMLLGTTKRGYYNKKNRMVRELKTDNSATDQCLLAIVT